MIQRLTPVVPCLCRDTTGNISFWVMLSLASSTLSSIMATSVSVWHPLSHNQANLVSNRIYKMLTLSSKILYFS